MKKCQLSNKHPKSTRKLSPDLNVSRTTIQRIIKKDLGLKSYKRELFRRLLQHNNTKDVHLVYGLVKMLEKMISKKYCFQMKNILIMMVVTIDKMIAFGQLILLAKYIKMQNFQLK